MKKYIQKLRDSGTETKKVASFTISFWITVIIVVLWILGKSIL